MVTQGKRKKRGGRRERQMPLQYYDIFIQKKRKRVQMMNFLEKVKGRGGKVFMCPFHGCSSFYGC